jgi:putative hydroxymethylpyrimidine transport system substrate-binding protein
MKLRAFIIALMLLASFVVGCGGDTSEGNEATGAETGSSTPIEPEASSDPFAGKDQVTLTLAGRATPGEAGIFVAHARGDFKKENLNVYPTTPRTPGDPIKFAYEEVADVAIAAQPQILLAKEKGVPIVAIGSLVSGPTDALIWLNDSGIEDSTDLRGRTIGFGGVPYEKALLYLILARAQVPPKQVKFKNLSHNLVPGLVSGRVDAIFGSWNVSALELKRRGLEPVVTRVQQLGIPPYDQRVLVTSRSRLREDPASIRRLMAALVRGAALATKDPAAATRLTLKNPEGAPKSTPAGMKVTLPLLSATLRSDPDQWARFAAWMQKAGLLSEQPPLPELVTNEYLPRGG